MYQNKISSEYEKDVKGKRLSKLNVFMKKEREYVLSNRSYEIAHRIVLWLKYYGEENISSLEAIVDEFCDEFKYYMTEKERKNMYSKVEEILIHKYKIEKTH